MKVSIARIGNRAQGWPRPPLSTPQPLGCSFVERLAGLTKSGEHRTKTHTHHLCPCDACGEVTYLPTNRVGVKCRMTPRCAGRHRKPEGDT